MTKFRIEVCYLEMTMNERLIMIGVILYVKLYIFNPIIDDMKQTYGTGMEMETSLSSKSFACSSYSIVTSHWSPFSFGQQFTEIKMKFGI